MHGRRNASGFVMIGAEWWYMWGSENFNGQIKAFHWSTVILLAILLHIPQRAALG
jgi:predicted small integral membrane protein